MDGHSRPKPKSYSGDLAHLPPALWALVAEERWVMWLWELNYRGKWTKVPYQPRHPTAKARTNAPETWTSHADAVARFTAGGADGIGFMLHDSEIAAFDIDDCRDAESGAIEQWALNLVRDAGSYCEITVSGTGLRIIGRATGKSVHRNQPMPGASGGRIETYRRAKRYIVVTGNELSNESTGELTNLDEIIDRVVAQLDRAAAETKAQGHAKTGFNLPPHLDEIIRRGVPVGRRSEQFHRVVIALRDLGWTLMDIHALLSQHSSGIASKFANRLWEETERSWNKASNNTHQRAGSDDAPQCVKAIPYVWTEPAIIPPRQWLYGHHLIRRFVSATVAPGGVGKSSLVIAEALAMASGKPLLGVEPRGRAKVWLWNLEDPSEELTRRVQATAQHYGLVAADFADRLFMNSGRDRDLVIARITRDGASVVRPVVDGLIAEIAACQIDVLTVDPFVSCHQVSENDNIAIDMVVKEWARVADRGNCAVGLVHHTRKMGGVEAEVTAESSRGGKAFTDACRSVRVVNRMSKEEGERAGIENHRLYFRTFSDKVNLAPPPEQSDWFRLESVDLGNGPGGVGDSVGVVVCWMWPDPTEDVSVRDLRAVQKRVSEGKWRGNQQAKDWVGRAVADVLRLDVANKADRSKINGLLKIWLANNMLVVVSAKDHKGVDRPFIEVGEFATD